LPNPQGQFSFTTKYKGIARTLVNDVIITPADIKDKSKGIQCKGIWDTGATGSVITKELADQLGIKPVGITLVQGVNSLTRENEYLINIFLPNNTGVTGVRVTEGKLVPGTILIGMDVITIGDFAVTHANRQTVMSFRMPSMGKIDFVEEYNSKHPQFKKLPSANSPCPCGSGKKYKRCHGKDAG